MTSPPLSRAQRRLSLFLVAVVHGINHATYNMLPPLEGDLTRYFGFTDISRVSAGFTLYLAVYGFSQLPIGWMSDRMPRKLMLAAGVVLNGIGVGLVALYPTYGMYLAGLALAGLGGATYHPVGVAYLSELFPGARGSALGVSGFGATAGLFFGPYLGGLLCDASGWRITFLTFAAINVAVGVLFALFSATPPPEHEDESAATAGGSAWTRPILIFVGITATIFAFREFAGWGGYFLVPVFCAGIYHFPASMSGLVSGMQSLGGFVSQPVGGWLSDRYGRRPLLMLLLAVCGLCMFVMPFAGRSLLIPVVILYGLCYSATVPILDALIADRAPARIRGAVFGIFMAAGIGFSSFSNLVLARILDATGATFRGFIFCFVLLAFSLFMAIVFVMISRRNDK